MTHVNEQLQCEKDMIRYEQFLAMRPELITIEMRNRYSDCEDMLNFYRSYKPLSTYEPVLMIALVILATISGFVRACAEDEDRLRAMFVFSMLYGLICAFILTALQLIRVWAF